MIHYIKIFTTITFSICFFTCITASIATADAEIDIFAQQVEPLGTIDCARCHEQAFSSLRDHGGAHKMDCRECHEQFHTTGRNVTWEQRVPACANCHEEPHGSEPEMIACLNCHSNVHAPVASLNIDKLEPLCATCHEAPATEMKQESAHSDMSCNDCHQERHGYLPRCIECHEEPHSTFESSTGCMQCHPVHNVSIMLYSDGIPNQPCAGCHEEAAQKLKQGHLAHAELNCVFCHADEHANIASCQDCHDTPHSPEMLKDFESCNACHGNPHDLLPGG